MVKEHSQLVMLLMGVGDLAVTAGAWMVSYYLRFHCGLLPVKDAVLPSLAYIDNVMVTTLLLTLLVFGWMGMYRPRRVQTFGAEFWDIIKACSLVWVLEVVITHFVHTPPPPRVSLILQAVFLAVWPTMIVAYRGTVRATLHFVRRRGKNLRNIAIVGAGRLGQKLLHALRQQRWTGYRVAYFVEDHRIGGDFLGVPVVGPIDKIDQIVGDRPVDAVFVALPHGRSQQLTEVLGRLSGETVDISVVPDLLAHHFLRHQVQQIGTLSIVNLTDSPQRGLPAAVKRAFDVAIAASLLIVASPLMVAIAVLIKLTSRGPVFFRQCRASLGGKEFEIVKFRSMVPGADRRNGRQWSTDPDDAMVTWIGRFLRKFDLDELPQLFNVLVGDMSLVGPRPELPRFIERFRKQVPRYALRHHVKAGMTGWAQVHGYRGRTSLRKRIQYDLDYINRWSIGLDIWILALTVFRIRRPDRLGA